MTVARQLPARTVYRCDICGDEGILPKDGEPNTQWRRYSSVLLDETCPDEVPTMCSDPCVDEFRKRLKDGRIRLPKLRSHGYYCTVTAPKYGYPLVTASHRVHSRSRREDV